MKQEKIVLRAGGALLETYFQEASPEIGLSVLRPCVLICPGGGYQMLSAREAEPIALAFAAQGFHAAVLRYPVAPARYPEALFSLAEAMVWLRTHAEENHINAAQITVCGFSAGGHLAASLGVFWRQEFLQAELGVEPSLLRPDRQILCYPVITGGAYAHHNSFDQLLGPSAGAEERAALSLEQHVDGFVPPSFLWHTYEDQIVPVENTLLFAAELRRHNVPLELHIYSEGEHGLALANDITRGADGGGICRSCEGWLALACAWLRRPVKAYIKR